VNDSSINCSSFVYLVLSKFLIACYEQRRLYKRNFPHLCSETSQFSFGLYADNCDVHIVVFLRHSRKITEDLCGSVSLVCGNVLLGQDFPTCKGIVMSSCLRVKKHHVT